MPIKPENRTRYPRDWKQISAAIKERAKWQCECIGECGRGHQMRCKARHKEPSPYTGSTVILTTAHLDHTPENCEDDNLKAMCQACHLAYDRLTTPKPQNQESTPCD
jgi:hypothetical protein